MSRVERVEKQETLAEIVAEMRRKSQEFFPDLPIAVLQLASRIEAAWKREREDLNPSGRGAAKTRGQKASARRAAESCLGTGEAEQYNTVQIGGKMSGGGRAEANRRGTATAGAAPEPAKSFGDAAAMREIVMALATVILPPRDKAGEGGWLAWVRAMQGKACAALAAPARNCDVGTAQEQIKRWEKFCLEHHEYWKPSKSLTAIQRCNCPCQEGNGCNYFVWAQMPYTEGGAK